MAATKNQSVPRNVLTNLRTSVREREALRKVAAEREMTVSDLIRQSLEANGITMTQ